MSAPPTITPPPHPVPPATPPPATPPPAASSKRRRTDLPPACPHPDKCPMPPSPRTPPSTAPRPTAANPAATSPSTALRDAVRAVQAGELSDAARAARIHELFAAARLRATRQPPRPSALGAFPGAGAPAGCAHYARRCWLRAFCCGRYYPCRRCHDEAEDHEIDRHATQEVACVECGDAGQPVAERCRSCGVKFARYFCGVCRFFDDTEGREAYHCDGCGICRVGKGLGIDNHHCDGCSSCVPIAAKDSHPCRERSLDANCPICAHYLASSTEAVVFMKCGHAIHKDCLAQHTASAYTCPICNKSLTDMSTWVKDMDERIARDVLPPEYANRVSRVLCHDCGEKTVVRFHFSFHKCACCGAYNTRVLEQFDVEGGAEARAASAAAASAAAAAAASGGAGGQQAAQLEEAT